MTHWQLRKTDFIRWLRKQPEDRTINFCDPSNCILASWLKECYRLTRFSVGPFTVTLNKDRRQFKPWMAKVSALACRLNSSGEYGGFTIGAFRDRYKP